MAGATLTTTSYAILGHLAMRPWTTYDLVAQMRRNVRYFYPRAESQVYEEPKRLVALGLAKVSASATGKRARHTYSITPAGRAALTAWLAQPATKGPALEFEGLLRVFLAPAGTMQDLLSTLGQVRADIAGLHALAEVVRADYLAGTAPFQRHAPTRAMVYDFLLHFARMVDEWAERSAAMAQRLDGMGEDERMREALRVFSRYALPPKMPAQKPRKAAQRKR